MADFKSKVDADLLQELRSASAEERSDRVEALLDNFNGDKKAAAEHVLVDAASRGHLDVAKVLIGARADVSTAYASQKNYTALMMASKTTHNLELVSMLLGAKAEVNHQADDGRTALMIASVFADVDVVRTLLRAGADIEPRDQGEKTARELALRRPDSRLMGSDSILMGIDSRLMKIVNAIDVQEKLNKRKAAAARDGKGPCDGKLVEDPRPLEDLLRELNEPSSPNISKKQTSRKNAAPLAEHKTGKPANSGPNCDQPPGRHCAAEEALAQSASGADDAIEEQHDSSPQAEAHLTPRPKEDQHHLEVKGIGSEDEDAVDQTKLEQLTPQKPRKRKPCHGRNLNQGLHKAAQNSCKASLAETPSDTIVSANSQEPLGMMEEPGLQSPVMGIGDLQESSNSCPPDVEVPSEELKELQSAIVEGKCDRIQALLNSSTNPKKAAEHVLVDAAAQGRLDVVKVLIGARADVSIADGSKKNYTALMTSALSDTSRKLMNTLLEEKADVNHQADDGCTALMVAALDSDVDVVTTLLCARADIELRDLHGCTARELALRIGQTQIVKAIDSQQRVNDKRLAKSARMQDGKAAGTTSEVEDKRDLDDLLRALEEPSTTKTKANKSKKQLSANEETPTHKLHKSCAQISTTAKVQAQVTTDGEAASLELRDLGAHNSKAAKAQKK